MDDVFREILLMRRKEIGEAVTDARKRKGWQQQELAAMCGMDVQVLRKIEYGEKNYLYDHLQLVELALGMRGGELFDRAAAKIGGLEAGRARYDALLAKIQTAMQERLQSFRRENVRKRERERRRRLAMRQY